MKTIICSFTGTGNPLAAAKKIAETPDDCERVPVASLQETCPVQAIQAGKKTENRARYRNPEIKKADLKNPPSGVPRCKP